MSMSDWAKHEVEVAFNSMKCNDEDNIWEGYAAGCYMSALKAYESLLEDNHSNTSIIFTKHILNRLIQGLPLTPINDDADDWVWCHGLGDGSLGTTYQHKRCSSLFKDKYNDGTIKYSDLHRIAFICLGDDTVYHRFGLAADIVNDMYPITFPYMPTIDPYKVYGEELLTDPANGDFDTVGIIYIKTPEGKEIGVHRYFKESDNKWVEIEEAEYAQRKLLANNR